MNFVVVGDRVEMAGSIAELANRALASDFRVIDSRCACIILVEAGPSLLTSFDPSLSERARRSLERIGDELRLRAAVIECDSGSVLIGAGRIESRTIIWAVGVKGTLPPNGSAQNTITPAASRSSRTYRSPDIRTSSSSATPHSCSARMESRYPAMQGAPSNRANMSRSY